jgi:hypothetical protein
LRSLIFSFWKRLFIYSKWNARTCSPSVLFCFAKEMNAFFDTCRIDTGIASEKEWGINLLDEAVKESGTNEDGSTWYRESGEDRGENGYRCRWTRMGGKSHDCSTVWTETVCSWLFTYSGIPYYSDPLFCCLYNVLAASNDFCVLCQLFTLYVINFKHNYQVILNHKKKHYLLVTNNNCYLKQHLS